MFGKALVAAATMSLDFTAGATSESASAALPLGVVYSASVAGLAAGTAQLDTQEAFIALPQMPAEDFT